jgi:hypothetical protein
MKIMVIESEKDRLPYARSAAELVAKCQKPWRLLILLRVEVGRTNDHSLADSIFSVFECHLTFPQMMGASRNDESKPKLVEEWAECIFALH